MTQQAICHLCVRRDPFTLIDWVCMPNGVFQPECLLRERNFGTQVSTPDDQSELSPGIRGSIGRKIGALVSGLTKASGASKAAAAAVAVIVAALGGYSLKGTDAAGNGSQKISHQLELAQNCLDAGILDCAVHLVEPIARADPSNHQAKKIDEAVKKQQASRVESPPASNQEQEEALVKLALANINYGWDCVGGGNFSCALQFSDLVLNIVPAGLAAGQHVREDAQALSKRAHLGR